MPKFAVEVREVYVVLEVVEAESFEDAVKKVDKDQLSANEISFEYSHTLHTDTWSVKEWDDEEMITKGKAHYYNESTGKFDKTIGG